ncbi:hypothetical protein [uncultured Prevotella sp.]|nr:hypothetical protein [uncultured Prevotella sp.]
MNEPPTVFHDVPVTLPRFYVECLPSLFGDSYEVKHLGEMNYATST